MEEEHKKVETQAASVPVTDQKPAEREEETGIISAADQDKNLAPALKKGVFLGKSPKASPNRDAGLSALETEKRNALIKAWEENEQARIENKTHKKLSAVGAWESTKRATAEAKIKKYEEKIELKKAEYAEKMKNKIAEIHKMAEEKKVMIDAKRSEECHKIKETADKFRASGYVPKKFYGCFG